MTHILAILLQVHFIIAANSISTKDEAAIYTTVKAFYESRGIDVRISHKHLPNDPIGPKNFDTYPMASVAVKALPGLMPHALNIYIGPPVDLVGKPSSNGSNTGGCGGTSYAGLLVGDRGKLAQAGRIVLHELGHGLGLGHVPDPNNIMCGWVTKTSRITTADQESQMKTCIGKL